MFRSLMILTRYFPLCVLARCLSVLSYRTWLSLKNCLKSSGIVGNCDEFLYLGGNEQSTHKYVSELLGKSTIDTNTYGKSEGRSGSYSTNYQISGRELLTPDEVRMLDNRYAILFIRGERPVLDFKYDILKHPNVALTADGKAGVYEHGEVKSNVATIELLSFDKFKAPETEVAETNYELLSDEDFEND